ncbi:MAG: hypothetical protein RI935_288 [Candidatus Parcubacteria bacterium]
MSGYFKQQKEEVTWLEIFYTLEKSPFSRRDHFTFRHDRVSLKIVKERLRCLDFIPFLKQSQKVYTTIIMLHVITSFVGIITITIMDYVWLANVAKAFYLDKLASHITIENGSLVPYFPAVVGFYIVAIISIWVFVLSRVNTLQEALLWGAILGFLMYAFYDLTNMATLSSWPFKLVVVDVLWGTILMGVTSAIMFYIKNLLS